MEKFMNLDNQKKDNIINSALLCFGSNGYKKTSINDIATKAGISKALIFHYFENKKNLYLFLVEFCSNIVTDSIETKFDKKETDFFKRIEITQDIKISVIKDYPTLFNFIKTSYFETDEEVKEDIKLIYQKYSNIGFNIFFDGIDLSKFKDNINPQMVMKLIMWCAEGYINELPNKNINVDLVKEEFSKYLILLKQNFYREGTI